MKKSKLNVQRYICILLCLVLYITVLPFTVSAEEAKTRTVRVGWYEGTYNTTGADGQRRGYSYEYQQAVAAHTGWKYEYVEGSWAELMSMLKNGQIDLLGGISYTEERSTSMLFSELPMGEDKYYLYVDTSNTDTPFEELFPKAKETKDGWQIAYDENGTAVSSNNATYYLTIIKETNGHLNHYSIVLKDADGDSIDTLDLKTAIPRTADEKKENS